MDVSKDNVITTAGKRIPMGYLESTSGFNKNIFNSGVTFSGSNDTITINNSILQLAGIKLYTNYQIFTSSGTFTAPAGVTQVFAFVVGGGGGGGAGTYGSSSPSDTPYTNTPGGTGGVGGLALGLVSVTPTTGYTVTVGAGGAGGDSGNGGAGGTSSFRTFSATGGSGGQAAPGGYNGATGANGSGTGGSTYNGNITSAYWQVYLGTSGLQVATYPESTYNTLRSTMSTLAVQGSNTNTDRLKTPTAWLSTGTNRPGGGGIGEAGGDYSYSVGGDTTAYYNSPDSSGGYSGAVILFY